MASKKDTKMLQALSESLYGDKNTWKKLLTKGVPALVKLPDGKTKRQNVPLTEIQAKNFMVRKLEARAKKEHAKRLAQAKQRASIVIGCILASLVLILIMARG